MGTLESVVLMGVTVEIGLVGTSEGVALALPDGVAESLRLKVGAEDVETTAALAKWSALRATAAETMLVKDFMMIE